VITFGEAVTLTAALARPLGREQVALAEAHGRVLAAPVIARIASPRADVSTMDGYAVRDADLAALPARLRIVGQSFPGADHACALEPGECVRIFTGAPVPPGADRVVIQENVRRDGEIAVFETPPSTVRFIRHTASDFAVGDELLPAGVRLGPRQLVAAGAADVGTLSVWRLPRIVVLSTGDELAEPGTARDQTGRIPDSISAGVAALAEEYGAQVIRQATLGDDLAELERAADLALREADVVVVTGGASVGERDFAQAMFAGHGLEPVFTEVAIKPGKPVWLARSGSRIVLGLPGNPTSAMVTARLFLAPLVTGLAGRDPAATLRWRQMCLAGPVGPVGDRETFARGVAEAGAVRLLPNQDSGVQKALAECGLLVRLRAGAPAIAAGESVDVLDF